MKKQLCSLLTALALAVGLLPSAARAPGNSPAVAPGTPGAGYAGGGAGGEENRRPLPTFPLPRGTRTRCSTSMKTVL